MLRASSYHTRPRQSPSLCSTQQGRQGVKDSGCLERMPPARPPTSERRPPTHFPEAEGGRFKSRTSPTSRSEPHLFLGERCCLFLGSSLTCAAKTVTQMLLAPDLTPWRQKPAPTSTSNNPQTQQQETFLKVNIRPNECQLEALGIGKGERTGAGVPTLSPSQLQRHWPGDSPEDGWPMAAWATVGVKGGNMSVPITGMQSS